MTSDPQLTEEDIDRWERLFRHKFPKTEFGPPNEWPALIALARKGLKADELEKECRDRGLLIKTLSKRCQSATTKG